LTQLATHHKRRRDESIDPSYWAWIDCLTGGRNHPLNRAAQYHIQRLLFILYGNPSPNRFHRILALLDCPTVLTTNFDPSYRAASDRLGIRSVVIANDDELLRHGHEPKQVIHIHGRAPVDAAVEQEGNGGNPQVFSWESYCRFSRERKFMSDYFKHLWLTRLPVILGSSLSDEMTIVKMMCDIDPERRWEPKFAPIWVCHKAPDIDRIKLARRCHIKIVWHSEGIGRFLEELHKAVYKIEYDETGDRIAMDTEVDPLDQLPDRRQLDYRTCMWRYHLEQISDREARERLYESIRKFPILSKELLNPLEKKLAYFLSRRMLRQATGDEVTPAYYSIPPDVRLKLISQMLDHSNGSRS
jgi:hypothetical protein